MVGVVIGGLIYEQFGARQLFRTFAAVSLLMCVAYSLHLLLWYFCDVSVTCGKDHQEKQRKTSIGK